MTFTRGRDADTEVGWVRGDWWVPGDLPGLVPGFPVSRALRQIRQSPTRAPPMRSRGRAKFDCFAGSAARERVLVVGRAREDVDPRRERGPGQRGAAPQSCDPPPGRRTEASTR